MPPRNDDVICRLSVSNAESDPIASCLRVDSDSRRFDPPPALHGRIMSAVMAEREAGIGIATLVLRAGRLRAFAAAACLALVAAGLMMFASWRNHHENSMNVTPRTVDHDGRVARQLIEVEGASTYNAMAAIDTFLEGPVPALRDELMQPLREEFDRVASAGDHLLRTTMNSLPPSLRAAGAGW